MSSAYQYDPRQVSLIIAAPPFMIEPVRGFASGTFIRAERSVKTFRFVPGVWGQYTRTRSTRKDGQIRFSLEQGAPANLSLTALQFADESQLIPTAGLGIVPVIIRDRSSLLDLAAAPYAWIDGQPPLQKKERSGTVEWTLDVPILAVAHGGLRQLDPGDDPGRFGSGSTFNFG